MRMRQLGQGQSVMFFAPPEIDAAIRKLSGKPSTVIVEDIILWSIEETLADIRHHLPYWAAQGTDYAKRRTAMKNLLLHPSDAKAVRELKGSWLQQEARSLPEMYDPTIGTRLMDSLSDELSARLEELGVVGSFEHAVDEEQEREVSHEMEVERQIERLREMQPAVPAIHSDITSFARTGKLRPKSSAFLALSAVLKGVPFWATHTRVKGIFNDRLLVTADFAKTVQPEQSYPDGKAIEFLNPVRWILSSRDSSSATVVIVSQHEANGLLADIRSYNHTRLHIYSPRTTKTMSIFDNLQFYCIPPLDPVEHTSLLKPLITQLNVFAGQLYPSSYSDYLQLCAFLGVDPDGKAQGAESDGFVRPENRKLGSLAGDSPFVSSPIPFVKALTSLRRKHQEFSLTPVGKLLDGRASAVKAEDF
jgi:hypothetical protein